MIPEGFSRVTDVIKRFTNFDHIDPKVLNNAADRGTRVHKFCTMYALNLLVIDPDYDCKGYVNSFIHWFDKNVSYVVLASCRLNSAQYRLSGELDLMCVLKNGSDNVLIDLKTPREPSLSWQLQTAAYRMLLRDVMGIDVTKRMCLMLPWDGSQAIEKHHNDNIRDEDLFMSALKLHQFYKS
jgi:hypothetical protein